MLKVEWLVAGVLLILSSVEFITGQLCWRRICIFVQLMVIKGLLLLLVIKQLATPLICVYTAQFVHFFQNGSKNIQ
jgi:hypothetical protein